MNLFPLIELSATEMQIIAKAFQEPAVVKYLKHLGYINAVQIAASRKEPTQTNEEYLLIQEQLRGGITMVETLLTIGADNPLQEEPSNR